MEQQDYDIIVVGAGFGGVTVAAALVASGRRVLLVDRNSRPGGKAMLASHKGAIHDFWPIAGGPTYGSRFDDLIRLVGLPRNVMIAADPVTDFIHLGADGVQRCMRVPAHPIRNPLAMLGRLKSFGAGYRELGGLLRMNLVSMLARGPLLDRYDNLSTLAWFEQHRLPSMVHDWLASLMNLFFVVPVDELPASEAMYALRLVGAGGAGRYHRGGYGSVAEAAVRYLREQGGTWLAATPVAHIMAEAGQVTGIQTENGDIFRAPVVVSNAGIQPTVLKLTGVDNFTPGYVASVRALQPSLAFVGVRYVLDKAFFQVPMTVVCSPRSWFDRARYEAAKAGQWPENPLLFVTVPSLYDPTLATAAAPQVALLGILCSPDPDSPMNRQAQDRLEQMAARLWPSLPGHIVHRARYGAAQVSALSRDAVIPGMGGECIGLGQLIGQCGRSKPDLRAPLKGLYFVGCDAGGRGVGTSQAVASGFNVARCVMQDRMWG